MLKGAPNKRLWANRYNGLGGHVERGEDILTGARRELKEEAGLECDDLWLCGTVTVDTGEEVGVGIFIFRGQIGEHISAHDMESPDGRLEWIDLKVVNQLPLVEDLHVLLPNVMKARRGDPVFAAHYRYNQSNQLVVSFGD